MRVTEKKETTKVVTEEITIKRICDNCHKELQVSEKSGLGPRYYRYNYFHITTHHNDWGNDSGDSYEDYDACCPECAIEMAKTYLTNAFKDINSKTIEIEHVRSLGCGTDRQYEHDISED